MATIYIPGIGQTSTESRAVDKAVNEYDERLNFRRNEDTGQWCVYIKMPHGEAPVPVFGFDQIPSPLFAVESLHKADSLRHGEKILDEMNKRNDDLLIPYNEAADDANGQMADAFEWAYRKMGSAKVNYAKSYRPKGK